MAAYVKIYCFVEDIAEKVHNLGSDALTLALTTLAGAPTSTMTNLASISPIAYTTFTGSRVPAISSSAQSTGTYKLVLADVTLTANATTPNFGAVTLYNDTAASDQLIAWWSYGSDISLLNTETFTIDFDPSGGVLTIGP